MKTMVLMVGGPAAGKSTVRQSLFADWTVVDCDEIKAMHPDFDPKNPGAIHDWSSMKATEAVYYNLSIGASFVFDSTGTNVEKLATFAKMAHAVGYSVKVVFVRCSLKTATARNAARDRTVDANVLREKHATVETAFEIISGYADEATIVQND